MHPSEASRPACARRLAAGFTLVELVIVMTIIAIAAAVAAPSFAGFLRASRSRAALRQVISHAIYARTYAVSHAVLARLELDPEAGGFELTAEKDPLERPGQFTPVRQAGRLRVYLPQGVQVESVEVAGEPLRGPGYIQFYPDGRTDGATISFRLEGGQRPELRVAANTGRVELHEQ